MILYVHSYPYTLLMFYTYVAMCIYIYSQQQLLLGFNLWVWERCAVFCREPWNFGTGCWVAKLAECMILVLHKHTHTYKQIYIIYALYIHIHIYIYINKGNRP